MQSTDLGAIINQKGGAGAGGQIPKKGSKHKDGESIGELKSVGMIKKAGVIPKKHPANKVAPKEDSDPDQLLKETKYDKQRVISKKKVGFNDEGNETESRQGSVGIKRASHARGQSNLLGNLLATISAGNLEALTDSGLPPPSKTISNIEGSNVFDSAEIDLIKSVIFREQAKKFIMNQVTKNFIEEETITTKNNLSSPSFKQLQGTESALQRKFTFNQKKGNGKAKEKNDDPDAFIFNISAGIDINLLSARKKKAGKKTTTKSKHGEALKTHLRAYLPIATYMSIKWNYTDVAFSLIEVLKKHVKDMDKFEPDDMLEHAPFLHTMIDSTLMLNEMAIFAMLMHDVPDVTILISKRFFKMFSDNNRLDYLLYWFHVFKAVVATQKIPVNYTHFLSEGDEPHERDDKVEKVYDRAPTSERDSLFTERGLNEDKLTDMIKMYFQTTDDNSLLMSIFKELKIPIKFILRFLLDSKDEERLVRIANDFDGLKEILLEKEEEVLRRRQYKLLILFDSKHLIDIFNEKIYIEEGSTGREDKQNVLRIGKPRIIKHEKINIYKELCTKIERGEDVEELCNVINYVNETFWDEPKAKKFFDAVYGLLYGPGNSWVIYIQNPLYFFMALANFFKELKEQLDYKDKKITELSEDMTNFCVNYIEHASDEVLKLNMFEKDGKDNNFLDYAFNVGNMKILEKEQIEGTIYKLWDQGRHTLQTLKEFMRVENLTYQKENFNLGIFKASFDIEIEEMDAFQMEYAYTSRSVYLKALSEIIWPVPLIILEFTYSMMTIQDYLDGRLHKDYFTDYLRDYPVQGYIHGFLRLSFLVMCVVRSLSLKALFEQPNFMIIFYNLIIFMNFLQFMVIPGLFDTYFWLSCNAQMLYVFIMIVYCLYNALALSTIGELIRIFFSMSLVVIYFGIVSYPLILFIAYAIHVIFLQFTQGIQGQLYPDLNLFSDLYQGMMTCFEFVFGAVVLVRPYQEQNMYTYATSFVMMMFSFFGNIMLANLLIGFLTSQFDKITQNSKYLTMKMQWNLIKVFTVKDLDSIFSLPYPLMIPALPFFAFMSSRNYRKKVNNFLLKFTHIVNVAIPFILMTNIKLQLLMVRYYIEWSLHFLTRSVFKLTSIGYLFVWILGGPYLLIKLYIKDNCTLFKILWKFDTSGKDIPNYHLGDETRNELVKIFQKIDRAAKHFANKQQKKVSIADFRGVIRAIEVQDMLFQAVDQGGLTEGLGEETKIEGAVQEPEDTNTEENFAQKNDLDMFYLQNEKVLLPRILKKYSTIEEGKDPYLDIDFLKDKLKNRINFENIQQLIAFEKSTLERASRYFLEQNDYTKEMRVNDIKDIAHRMDDKIKRIFSSLSSMKKH